MSLGEKIYKLRIERNLSQGDLAEMLEVSRQSVSKWETNGSVPDLDKIIKLSSIFDVTLDELVLGKEAAGSMSVEEVYTYRETEEHRSMSQGDDKLSMPPDNASNTRFPPRKIAGTILLCMAFLVVLVLTMLGAFLEGLVLAIPFTACGIVCFMFKQNVGLWCAWTIYTIIEVFSRYMTGSHWSMALQTFNLFRLGMKINSITLIVSWIEFAGLIVLITITVAKCSRKSIPTSKRTLYGILAGWFILVVLNIPMPWVQWMVDLKMFGLYQIYITILTWIRVILFTVLATKSVQYIHSKKCSK